MEGKCAEGIGKITQWVKALEAHLDLSVTARTHMVEGENLL